MQTCGIPNGVFVCGLGRGHDGACSYTSCSKCGMPAKWCKCLCGSLIGGPNSPTCTLEKGHDPSIAHCQPVNGPTLAPPAIGSAGRKDDSGKPRYDLIPPIPLKELAELFAIGAKKYGPRNWEKGIAWGRFYRAMMGHANAFWSGEERDSEDGQKHLTSVAWCALVLLEYGRTHPELDDRPQGLNHPRGEPSNRIPGDP